MRRVGSERIVAVAFTDWVLLNDAGRPGPATEEIPEAFGTMGDFTPLRVNRGAMPDDASTRNFVVRRSETDPMAHVNNAGYVDYLDEQYLAMYEAPIEAPLPVPRRYRAEFVGSALPGSRLTGRSWQWAAWRGATALPTKTGTRCSAPRSRWTPLRGSAAEDAVVVGDELITLRLNVLRALLGDPCGRDGDPLGRVAPPWRAGRR